MSFGHSGSAQMLQRAISAVMRLQDRHPGVKTRDTAITLVSNGGSGALFSDVLILGRDRP
jgi:hypothetical protein